MSTQKPRNIIRKLLDNDPFSQWLGIELLSIEKGSAEITMTVSKQMLNGFSVAHGAVPYALADTALAFAAGTRNQVSLTLTNNISYLRKIERGDILIAKAKELSLRSRYGVYQVEIRRDDDIRLASFRGTVYRSSRTIEEQLESS